MVRYPIELYRDQYSAILEGRQHIVFLYTTEVPKTIQCGDVLTLLEIELVDEEEQTGYFFHVDIVSLSDFTDEAIFAPELRGDCYVAVVKLKTGRRIRLPAYDLLSWEKTTGIKYIEPVLKEVS